MLLMDFMRAIEDGDLEKVKSANPGLYLVSKYQEGGVFCAACYYGNLEIVEYFVGLGMNVDDIRQEENHALRCACDGEHHGVVEYLINQGLTGDDIMAALCQCCKIGKIDTVKYFLDNFNIPSDLL